MRLRSGACALAAAVLVAAVTPTNDEGRERRDEAVKSMHLLDLPVGVSRKQIEQALVDLNRAIDSTGHSGARYMLWEVNQARVPGYPSVGYDFVMEGVWPSQSVYDEVHRAPAFREAIQRHSDILQAVSDASAYSKYREVRLGGDG